MVGMALGAAAASQHVVSHHCDNHRHHSHTEIESHHKPGLMDTDESHSKDPESTLTSRIQGPRDGLLPPPSERVFTSVLEKKTITSKGLYWKTRNAVLSRDYLSFGKLVEDW
jgi:hypothetical protein